jgi:hypothetical protein
MAIEDVLSDCIEIAKLPESCRIEIETKLNDHIKVEHDRLFTEIRSCVIAEITAESSESQSDHVKDPIVPTSPADNGHSEAPYPSTMARLLTINPEIADLQESILSEPPKWETLFPSLEPEIHSINTSNQPEELSANNITDYVMTEEDIGLYPTQ